ncbi:MAG: hypothetical protein M3Q98_02040 [Actinomycetota bacterium]|nr:hypothetical protein [Actinomycetota bacterium]
MNQRGKAFVYFEPTTRFHAGAVFADRESAIQWAEKVATRRGETDWVLNARIDGRWVRVHSRTAVPTKARRVRLLR